jgi:hypothetical protein
METEFTVPWTEELVLAAQYHHLDRVMKPRPRWALFLALLFGALFAGSFYFGPPHYFTWVYGIGFILMLGIRFGRPALVKAMLRRDVRAALRKFGTYDVVYQITDEGVETRSPTGNTCMAWDKFEALWRFEDMWLLFFTRAQFFVLPTDKIAGDLGDFVVEKVRANGGKVK